MLMVIPLPVPTTQGIFISHLVPLLFLLLGSLPYLRISILTSMVFKDPRLPESWVEMVSSTSLLRVQETLNMTRRVLTQPRYPNILKSGVFQESPTHVLLGTGPVLLASPQRFSLTRSRCQKSHCWSSVEALEASAELPVSGKTSERGHIRAPLNAGTGYRDGSDLEVTDKWRGVGGRVRRLQRRPSLQLM